MVERSNREERQTSYFVEVLPEGGIATLEARLRSRGNEGNEHKPHGNLWF